MTTQVQPKSRTVTANGINLHYLDWGTEGNPPLVLLHGLRGHAHVWADVAESLCGDYHVYAVDQRGRGDTDHAPGGDYSTEAFVADLLGFVDAVGLDKFVLFGHSMGGRNSMAFAGEHPERLERLCIVDIGPRIEPAGGNRITEELRAIPPHFDSFEDALAHVQGGNRFASEAVMRRRLAGQTRQLPDGKLGWKFDPAIREQRINGTAAPATDLWPALENITCPTLVVRGTETDLLTQETADRMVDTLAQGSMVNIERAGHMVFEDNPSDFIDAVKSWLAG
ncbi:MAG: alpha/beta hydrolase [Chloroflexota bacterium]|nr:alpha/beta hydrolase [Chloroflexota bacterium]MDE2961552.1 alpha/beta hydrolase [Chloroflexota bacterium]